MRSVLLAVLPAVLVLAGAPEASAQESPPLVIEHADQVQRLSQGDSISYYLDGNVRARRGDLRLTAQHAVVLDWLGLLDLTRDVHVWDEDTELFADHVTYTDSIDLAIATGNVQVIERETRSELQAQQVVYDRAAGIITATQSPEMVLLPRSSADDADSTPPAPTVSDTSRAAGEVVSAVSDTTPVAEAEAGAEAGAPQDADTATADADADEETDADTAAVPIRVWSEQVQLFTEAEDVVATGNVLIRRGEDLTAKADSAIRSGAAEVLRLRGSPRVETDRFYVEGDELDVLLPDDELETLIARGRARASSVADSIPPAAVEALGNPSPNSWLSADTLRFAFEDETLRAIRAIGDARSLSYGLESRAGDAVTWALNYLLAGRIALHFDETGESLQRVDAAERGRGVYRTAALAGAEGEPVAPTAPADTLGGREGQPVATADPVPPGGAPSAADAASVETAVSDTLPLPVAPEGVER